MDSALLANNSVANIDSSNKDTSGPGGLSQLSPDPSLVKDARAESEFVNQQSAAPSTLGVSTLGDGNTVSATFSADNELLRSGEVPAGEDGQPLRPSEIIRKAQKTDPRTRLKKKCGFTSMRQLYRGLLNSDVGDKLIYFVIFREINRFKLDF